MHNLRPGNAHLASQARDRLKIAERSNVFCRVQFFNIVDETSMSSLWPLSGNNPTPPHGNVVVETLHKHGAAIFSCLVIKRYAALNHIAPPSAFDILWDADIYVAESRVIVVFSDVFAIVRKTDETVVAVRSQRDIQHPVRQVLSHQWLCESEDHVQQPAPVRLPVYVLQVVTVHLKLVVD